MGYITRKILNHSAIASASSATTIEAYIKDFVAPKVFARFFDEKGGSKFSGFDVNPSSSKVNTAFLKCISGISYTLYNKIKEQD